MSEGASAGFTTLSANASSVVHDMFSFDITADLLRRARLQ
jgi:hypothetical protein